MATSEDTGDREALRTFGQWVRKLRDFRGMYQRHLAEETGISVVQIRRYEKAKEAPPLDRAVNIARVLGGSLDRMTGLLPVGEDELPTLRRD